MQSVDVQWVVNKEMKRCSCHHTYSTRPSDLAGDGECSFSPESDRSQQRRRWTQRWWPVWGRALQVPARPWPRVVAPYHRQRCRATGRQCLETVVVFVPLWWWSLAPRTTQTTTIAMMMTRMAATTGTIRLRCDRMILIVCSVVRLPSCTSRAGAIVPEMRAPLGLLRYAITCLRGWD